MENGLWTRSPPGVVGLDHESGRIVVSRLPCLRLRLGPLFSLSPPVASPVTFVIRDSTEPVPCSLWSVLFGLSESVISSPEVKKKRKKITTSMLRKVRRRQILYFLLKRGKRRSIWTTPSEESATTETQRNSQYTGSFNDRLRKNRPRTPFPNLTLFFTPGKGRSSLYLNYYLPGTSLRGVG